MNLKIYIKITWLKIRLRIYKYIKDKIRNLQNWENNKKKFPNDIYYIIKFYL